MTQKNLVQAAPPRGRIGKVCTLGLTAFALILMGIFFVMSLGENFWSIYNSARLLTKIEVYYPEGRAPSALEKLSARLTSLNAELADTLYLADELGEMNATLQYATGKLLISTGDSRIVTMRDGYLCDMLAEASADGPAADVIALYEALGGEYPFLFLYEHPTVYDQTSLPIGFRDLDTVSQYSDELVAKVALTDINMIDSRDVLLKSEHPLEDFLLRTDYHWTILAALTMTGEVAGQINDIAGLNLDLALLDPAMFESEVYESIFFGKYAELVGVSNCPPDDLTIYWPSYATNITRHTETIKDPEDASGDFKSSVIRWDKLERDQSGWNTSAYSVYGLTDMSDHYYNPDGADCKILLIKDSYSAPIGAFLSLVARDVYCIDLRKTDDSAMQFVRDYDPDIVILAYSQQMFRQGSYTFVD